MQNLSVKQMVRTKAEGSGGSKGNGGGKGTELGG
jgi:hypothetical protein